MEILGISFGNTQNLDTSKDPDVPKESSQSKGGGIHLLKEESDVNAKIASLTRVIEALKLGRSRQPPTVCGICACDTLY